MKDGMPEVLIIGEGWTHPTDHYSKIKKLKAGAKREELLEEIKIVEKMLKSEIKLTKEFGAKRILFEQINTEATEKLLRDHLKPGAQKEFLSELCKCETLILQSFINKMKEVLLQCALAEDFVDLFQDNFAEAGIWSAKVLTRIVYSTNIFDVKFFDDYEMHLNEAACNCVFSLLLMPDTIFKPLPASKLRAMCEELQRNGDAYSDARTKIARMLGDSERARDKAIIRNVKKLLIHKTVIICGSVHAKDLAEYFSRTKEANVQIILI